MAFHDIFGMLGVTFIVVMYLLLQTGRIDPARPAFSIFNALGAALILLSLAFEFNLAAALIEGFWLLISLYGLGRALWRRGAD
jgi:hypothetical protein